MRAVNLLPAPRVEKRQDDGQSRARTTKATAVVAALVLVLAAVVLGYGFVQARTDANDRQARLEAVQAQVAQVQASAAISAAAAAQTQAHLNAVTTAASNRMAWDGLLDQLSRVMPRGAWLDSLQTTAAAAPAPATSSDSSSSTGSAVVTSNALSPSSSAPAVATFTVSGFAKTQATVANVLERLALIPALSDVSLQSTQRADVAGKKAVQFTIGANVRAAGGNG
jgi:Tfp pilus assembly protein PilN